MNQQIIDAVGYPDSLIQEYEHWMVVLRLEQVTIGSLVIIAKSDSIKLGNLPSEIWAEFARVSADCERLLEKTFGAEKFNYLALMMKDPNVHFHFIPRYSKPVDINGKEYVDADWPLKTELNGIVLSQKDMETIKSLLRASL